MVCISQSNAKQGKSPQYLWTILYRYEDSLPYLHDAYMKNTEIMQKGSAVDRSNPLMRGIDIHLLASTRNQCLEVSV